MPTSKDYYNILGVKKDASVSDIKKAYRKLAHRYHPDKGGTAEDERRFREVNEAYQVLSDPAKRQQYDQFGAAPSGGAAGSGPGFGGAPPGGEGFGQGFGFDTFGDIFEQFFGGGAATRTRGPARGADLEVLIQLSFDEAVRGVQKQVRVTRRVTCPTCQGNGAEPGTKIVACDRCGGRGEIRTTRQTVLGAMQQVAVCPVCQGEGKRPEKPCHTCAGEGRVQKAESVGIDIPAGIDDGQTIRLPGQGESGQRGAAAGHLYVTVRVAPSKVFERRGLDVHLTVPITYPQAVLGDTIAVPTLTGEAKMKVPAGTSAGKTFRLKGQGIATLNGSGKGDELVTVDILVPKKLSAEERATIEVLHRASGGRPAAKKGLFNKLGL